ncbi:MAG: hypothetical protein EZS28_010914, partial [Streblomastix strix]
MQLIDFEYDKVKKYQLIQGFEALVVGGNEESKINIYSLHTHPILKHESQLPFHLQHPHLYSSILSSISTNQLLLILASFNAQHNDLEWIVHHSVDGTACVELDTDTASYWIQQGLSEKVAQ